MTTTRYQVSIESSQWGHSVESFTNKSEAIKKAREVRSMGCFFSDDLSQYDLNDAAIVVYDNQISEAVFSTAFTKKYISYRAK